jgi:excisionase family DNA binding protein
MASRDNTLAELRAEALELRRATADKPLYIDGEVSVQLARVIGISVLRAGLDFLKARIGGQMQAPADLPLQRSQPIDTGSEAEPEVMTADQVAAFLGVDRNTVYDYAGRGVIPHQRLGKRILFHRGALVSWLDASCKAASARKG